MQHDNLICLFKKGQISSLDFQFSKFLTRLSGSELPELALAAALVSKFTQEGHICFNLSSLAGKPFPQDDGDEVLVCPELSLWSELLKKTSVVGKPGDFKPLILDDKSRLYLFRYWEYETRLAEKITFRAKREAENIDRNILSEGLARLFPLKQNQEIDWQRVAAATSVLKKFSVISGGPGTGKTTTVVKILSLLLGQVRGKKLRIALTAPTGKAAARLQEAIKKTKKDLTCSEMIKEAIPEEASTIHRLLGVISGSPYFRHTRENQLPIDVIVVDEVSMVPLALMAKLNDAVPLDAWMILLGDKDQLASVEPGSVLGDICDTGKPHSFSQSHCAKLGEVKIPIKPQKEENPGIQDSLVSLQKSFRFTKESGIGEISLAVNDGDNYRALSIFKSAQYPDIIWKDLPHPQAFSFWLRDKVISAFGKYIKTNDPEKAISIFEKFRILCALREGPYGVRYVNFLVEQILRSDKLIPSHQTWYAGLPIMITRNDYNLKLFNGDVGIVLPDSEMQNELQAFFPSSDGKIRKFSPLRLPKHENSYALTVHKSQGSEFDEILFILPNTLSPVLSRELIYTAITRAKKRVEIWGKEEIFQAAVSYRIERSSGLREALWKERGES